jgi:hypothetical protein
MVKRIAVLMFTLLLVGSWVLPMGVQPPPSSPAEYERVNMSAEYSTDVASSEELGEFFHTFRPTLLERTPLSVDPNGHSSVEPSAIHHDVPLRPPRTC